MNEWEWQLLEECAAVESVSVAGAELKKGDFVRLRPRPGGDIFDLALAGHTAIIETIEQDYEGKLHLAVVIEDDPGKDLGVLRQPGHRFFFSPDEVDPVGCTSVPNTSLVESRRILVAGIGNIFHGDDGFGVEVIRKLSARAPSDRVSVKDFGIRGYDLAYALLDGYDVVLLVDASPRGDVPGTLYVMELETGRDATDEEVMLDAHAMNPVAVLRLAKSIGDISGRILLVACEPATLGGEEGQMGLSEVVGAAVDRAVQVVEKLVAKILAGGKPEELF